MKYKLLINCNPTALSEEVTRHLDNGWSLYGDPISTVDVDVDYEYGQAVVKKTRVNPMSQS